MAAENKQFNIKGSLQSQEIKYRVCCQRAGRTSDTNTDTSATTNKSKCLQTQKQALEKL